MFFLAIGAIFLGFSLGMKVHELLTRRETRARFPEPWLLKPIKDNELAAAFGLVIGRYLQFPDLDIDSTINWVFDAHLLLKAHDLGLTAAAVPGFDYEKRTLGSGKVWSWQEIAHLFLKLKLQALIDCGLGCSPTPVRRH